MPSWRTPPSFPGTCVHLAGLIQATSRFQVSLHVQDRDNSKNVQSINSNLDRLIMLVPAASIRDTIRAPYNSTGGRDCVKPLKPCLAGAPPSSFPGTCVHLASFIEENSLYQCSLHLQDRENSKRWTKHQLELRLNDRALTSQHKSHMESDSIIITFSISRASSKPSLTCQFQKQHFSMKVFRGTDETLSRVVIAQILRIWRCCRSRINCCWHMDFKMKCPP